VVGDGVVTAEGGADAGHAASSETISNSLTRIRASYTPRDG
jgi:hypothetical protein